jgi:hypothetical protein
MWFCRLVIILAIGLLALDAALSPASAADRWVGTVQGDGVTLGFTVVVNPGDGASFQWTFGRTVIASGPLAATVSGSRVNGTLFTTGGIVFKPGVCCRPCNFSGTIFGNTVNGSLDPVSCDGSATFSLSKQ